MALNEKRRVFCAEYIVDLNATQAAIRAGYSEKTAYSQGQRLLKDVEVQGFIQELKQARSERTEITQDDVLKRLQQVAFANANALSSVRVGACRNCHGHNHDYQWRNEAEYADACDAYFDLPDEARSRKRQPTMEGGYGYSFNRPPHEDCPRCEGFGITRPVFKDTTRLSVDETALYAGVKETQHGLEIKTHDQMAALDKIAKHLGMFPSKVELTGKGGGPMETINTNMSPQEAAEAYAATLDSDEG